LKILILTYYWPPSGGSGVQRWLQFVKYLQDFGVTPVVYTVENPSYAIEDSTLASEIPKGVEVLRRPIWEPYSLLAPFSKNKTTTKAGFLTKSPTFFGKLVRYVRANYFIHDSRKFWIRPSVHYLEAYLQKNPVDVIVSSGPPHSLHLIAMQLKKKTNTPWVADFRDPWTAIDYFQDLPLTKRSKRKHLALEEEVLKKSDAVWVVGKTMQTNYASFNKQTKLVPNGYDVEISEKTDVLDAQFTITHVGMMNEDRNPHLLWEVLQELSEEVSGFSKKLKVQLIGKVASRVLESIQKSGLEGSTELIGYLPHKEVQKYQRKSQVLLLAINNVPSAKGIVTGKLFEYLASKRPVLAIGPEDGDLAGILEETRGGVIAGFENKEKLKEAVLTFYKAYLEKETTLASQGVEKYHRKEITAQLVHYLKEVTA
jgi:glycosyltransferase involved in cell wall biosynthesis